MLLYVLLFHGIWWFIFRHISLIFYSTVINIYYLCLVVFSLIFQTEVRNILNYPQFKSVIFLQHVHYCIIPNYDYTSYSGRSYTCWCWLDFSIEESRTQWAKYLESLIQTQTKLSEYILVIVLLNLLIRSLFHTELTKTDI